jgi:hypothetical protein
MQNYEVFTDRERAGWSDAGIADAYVARVGPITATAAKNRASGACYRVPVPVAVITAEPA